MKVKNFLDAFLEPLHLLLRLFQPLLYRQLDEFRIVCVGHFLVGAAGAEFHGLLVREDRREVLVDDGVEVFGLVALGGVLEVLEEGEGVLVEAVEVFHGHRVADELLPEEGREVPVHGGAGSEVEAEEAAHEFEKLLVSWRSGTGVESERVSAEAVIHSIVDRFDQEWKASRF